jgi:hypothetical protein
MGQGDGFLLDWSENARWQVVRVLASSVVDLGGKAKFPRGTVVYSGTREGALACLMAKGAVGPLPGANVSAGDGSTVTGGDGSTVTGGDGSTVTGGDGSTVTGGDGSTVTGGYRSTVTGGDGSILSVRWYDGSRCRLAVGYVGENGVEAGAPYRVENGRLVPVGKE